MRKFRFREGEINHLNTLTAFSVWEEVQKTLGKLTVLLSTMSMSHLPLVIFLPLHLNI
jgi:hypothetical protein